jgi:D-hydroxyproline dehydrogenase subunit gamma
MFRPLEATRDAVTSITVDGRAVSATPGVNLAAALLEAGFAPFRTTPVSGTPRLPYCMMGVCFDCLAVVDGVPNRQTCLEQVRPGMTVERQVGPANAGATP